jgi:hypothetical protein
VPHELVEIARTSEGRLLYTKDLGESLRPGAMFFQSHLLAKLTRSDGSTHLYDLGSGLVTNVGVTAMMNDWNWASPSGAAINTLKLQNWVATGTGSTAAAATDIALQTLAAPTTANAVSGAQSNVTAANLQKFQQVTTINYTSSLAITEWGLHSAQVLSATTGTPFTSGTATTGTVTGTPYTASSTTVQGEQQLIVQDTTAASPFYGVILSNTSSVLTVPAWYLVSNGTLSGVNPVNADALLIKPVMWDHKVFSQINVNNGDSIQFTYVLTINSGG